MDQQSFEKESTDTALKSKLRENLEEIADRSKENPKNFFEQFQESINLVNNLANPLEFQKSGASSKPQILIFGESGSGKRTSLDYLIKEYLKNQTKKLTYKQKSKIKSVRGSSANNVNIIPLDNISYIYTPSIDDLDQSTSDTRNFSDIVYQLQEPLSHFGIASVLQCIKVTDSGLVNDQSYKLMSKMLQTLTITYPDRNASGPLIQVLFTNLSRYQYKNAKDDFYDSESNEDFTESENEFDQNKKSKTQPISFDKFVQYYKDGVCYYLQVDQKMSNYKAMLIVNQYLPKSSFFAFKMFKSQNKMNQELIDIQKINNGAIKHGSYKITNLNSSHLLPVVMPNNNRDQNISQIKILLNQCESIISNRLDEYSGTTQGQFNQAFFDTQEKIIELMQKFDFNILKLPFYIQKLDPHSFDIIIQILKNFITQIDQFSKQQYENFINQQSQKLSAEQLLQLEEQRKREEQEYEMQLKLEEEQRELKSKRDKEIFLILNSEHTFKNEVFEKQKSKIKKSKIQQKIIPPALQLDPNNFIGSQLDVKIFCCPICKQIAQDPLQCPECEFLICSQCITKNKNICPNRCNNLKTQEFKKVNRIVKEILDQQNFKCGYDEECQFKGSYNDALSHLENCDYVSVKCVCGDFFQQKYYENHRNLLCVKAQVMCENCQEIDYPNIQNFHHNCLQNLKKKVNRRKRI